jgi:anti-sigma factor RsiW
MTCRGAIEVLSEYRSGELTPERRSEVDRHLADCADCTEYFASYPHTQGLARDAFETDDPPADMPDALARSILDARRRH